MKTREIIGQIERIAPLWGQADWDASGLQVASGRDEAFKIAVCLDPIPSQISRAIAGGADFILSHHPLIMRPQMPNRHNAFYEVVKQLMRADVPLYSAHTSLDVNMAGPAGWLGEALRLQDARILEETARPSEAYPAGLGFGGAGSLPEAVPAEEFMARILRMLRLRQASCCGPAPSFLIGRVAWCGGSGSSLCEAAASAGADIFITGDIKYHAALEAPLPVLDVGHFSLENEMMARMANLLRQRLPGVEVEFLDGLEPFRIVSI